MGSNDFLNNGPWAEALSIKNCQNLDGEKTHFISPQKNRTGGE